MKSHISEGGTFGSSERGGDKSPVSQVVGACPYVNVSIGGVAVRCLLDTGSMVSTMSESFFFQNFKEKLQLCNWLQLKAANGLEIPYLGYAEFDVEVFGKVIPRRGVLVVRETPASQVSPAVPGILGMNIIAQCYEELFQRSPSPLFDLPGDAQLAEAWQHAFQACQMPQSMGRQAGLVKVRGKWPVHIPGGTVRWVAATCSQHLAAQTSTALFEPCSRLDAQQPDLLLSPAVVRVVRGTAYIPVFNVGSRGIRLHSRALLGQVSPAQIVSLPPGVSEVASTLPGLGTVTAVVNSQQDQLDKMEALIQSMDLSALPETDQVKVRLLLLKHKSVFSAHEGDLGCTGLLQHEIPLLDDAPVRQRHRRIPPSDYDAVKAHINQLLETQVIRESCSPYASPIVLVRKKDGSLRLCVDYRQLNSKTRRDSFPLPRIEESLDALCGAHWFSTMDLASGYNQVPVAEKDKSKTAFCTPFGLFEFNRMPFGLCNAPSTFQRLMERMFGAQHFETLLLYLDDIIVFSASVDQHLERLDAVLTRLHQEGLKVKMEKCCFFQTEVRYLGHVISKDGVATDPDKITAVSNWARPQNVSALRSFLGFASYYRRFVKGFSHVAAPLHRLVAEAGGGWRSKERAVPFGEAWTETCERSFEELKARLIAAPVLAYADFSLPFILEIDASYSGLGAVLSQEQGGKIRPIAYASRALSRSERKMPNYSSMKLEFLALKWAMADKFRE